MILLAKIEKMFFVAYNPLILQNKKIYCGLCFFVAFCLTTIEQRDIMGIIVCFLSGLCEIAQAKRAKPVTTQHKPKGKGVIMYEIELAKTKAQNALETIRDYAEKRASLYALPAQKEIVKIMHVQGALDSAAQAFKIELIETIQKHAKNGIKIEDCKSLVQSLKDCKIYPDNWPMPQSIYNGAKARENQGRESTWIFESTLVKNLTTSEVMQKSEFLQILRICKTFDKQREKDNKNRRLVELHKDVMALMMQIDKAVRLRNVEKTESAQAALKIAWNNAESKGVVFNEDEKNAYNSAMLASTIAPIRKAGTDKHLQARIDRAEAAEREALAKAEAAEMERKAQAEKAEKLQAEAIQAAEAREQWARERAEMAEKNRQHYEKAREIADRYNNLLKKFKLIPEKEKRKAMSKAEMMDLLDKLAE